MNTSTLVQKVWNFCHTLRDDGVGYGDYVEQLTYLLFLKLAHEYAQEPYHRDTHIPKGYDWATLRTKTGEPLEAQYLGTLHKLGQEPGMLGAIFFKAQNKIQDPAKLSRLVQMIDAENWIGLDADTKGDLYEGLLQKNAEDTKSGAGQYFTPRAFHTTGVWFYDLRTNKHFTLKTRPLKRDDLQEFIASYHPENRHERRETERFKFFSYQDLMARDKASLDIFWLKDDSLDNLDDLPPPDVLQQEIIEHLEAALALFRDVAAGLQRK